MELITGKTGAPHVYAADDAELYRLFLGDGAYVLPTGNKLNATMNGASSVRVFDGSIIMQGRLAKIRPTTGFDELSLAAGVVGQKRVDLVVAEYHKEQEEVIDAWIVGDEPLARQSQDSQVVLVRADMAGDGDVLRDDNHAVALAQSFDQLVFVRHRHWRGVAAARDGRPGIAPRSGSTVVHGRSRYRHT